MTGTVLLDLATRVGPVLVFLVAITVVAEIADARRGFRRCRALGRPRRSWPRLATTLNPVGHLAPARHG